MQTTAASSSTASTFLSPVESEVESDSFWHSPQKTTAIKAQVEIPGSKSLTARALVLALLSRQATILLDPLSCRDTDLMTQAIQALGAKVVELSSDNGAENTHETDHAVTLGRLLKIIPPKQLSACTIDCGLSGTVMRFLPAVAALGTAEIHFTGDSAAEKRPMRPLLEALSNLGAKVTYHKQEGFLPFSITGIGCWEKRRYLGAESAGEEAAPKEDNVAPAAVNATDPVTILVDSASSSQFLSALLLLAPRIPQGAKVRLSGEAPSATHVAMTLGDLARSGASFRGPNAAELLANGLPYQAEWEFSSTADFAAKASPENHLCTPFSSPSQPARPSSFNSSSAPAPVSPTRRVLIEPDLTNAGIFLAGLALHGGELIIPNWPVHTEQPGDYWREIMAAFTGVSPELIVSSAEPSAPTYLRYQLPEKPTLQPVDLDLQAHGELAPTVAALASLAPGTSYLRNIGHLRGHETDRLAALQAELSKLGAQVEIQGGNLAITGISIADATPVNLAAASAAPAPSVPERDRAEIIFCTYHDHRMAMSGALLSSVIPEIKVENMRTVRKTFPTFPQLWENFIRSGQGQEELA